MSNDPQPSTPAERFTNEHAMTPKQKSSLKTLLTIAIVALAAYFAHTEFQSHLGRKALDATGLQVHTLEEAFAASEKSGKPILADLSAIWCPSCRKLDSEVLAHESVKSKIERDYIFARIEYETEEGQAFMKQHQLRGFPSLLILDSNGAKQKDLPRTFSPDVFLKSL